MKLSIAFLFHLFNLTIHSQSGLKLFASRRIRPFGQVMLVSKTVCSEINSSLVPPFFFLPLYQNLAQTIKNISGLVRYMAHGMVQTRIIVILSFQLVCYFFFFSIYPNGKKKKKNHVTIMNDSDSLQIGFRCLVIALSRPPRRCSWQRPSDKSLS